MFYHNLNPVLLNLGPLQIRYYGIIFALGFLITYFLVKSLSKKKKLPLKNSDVDSLMIYLIIGVVLGARLFEIIFYNPQYFFSNPLRMLAVWQGGLSFHGGLLGAFLATYIFCKKRKIKFLQLADILVIPASLALALGRIGNFINSELYGKITSLPWGVKFQNAEGFRHPSQIYESLKNFFIFFVLLHLNNKKHKPGFLFAMFLILYSTLRFFIEFVREPEIIICSLTMGQLLSIPVFLIGLVMLIKLK